MHKGGTFTETTRELLKEHIKVLLIDLKESVAAIGNAAGEALVKGNNEPMKKALENYELEVEKIRSLEKLYDKKQLVLISVMCSDEFREICQILEGINPDFIREHCGIEK